ncbi:SGNH/GDSL hydrolase family protein [Croceivirga sp. JEA036]|uniref:SGNH/GDSL hydrolase family protein n=1 Tax=Croceivirga sp. JEA036 TaxID=2721162 RepID=UPI0014388D68|nr:SGNH/GDSL hydrolase family protein [Croceivirga sp. JEA036]NJB35525.1 acylhydrolase [Croceivirga sp. JEA036]
MKLTKTFLIIMLSILGISQNSKAQEQDWPNLAKYQKANAEAENVSVVFMGNSITEGWANVNPDFFANNNYANRGISGQSTPQMVLRFRQDVIALQPKAVVILAGTNDIAGNTGPMTLEQIRDNMLSMVEMAQRNDITPIVCSVLPAYDYPWRPGLQPNIKIPKLNLLLQEVCNNTGAVYLDYFTPLADERNGLPKELSYDEVHLTKEGYKKLEKLVTNCLNQQL